MMWGLPRIRGHMEDNIKRLRIYVGKLICKLNSQRKYRRRIRNLPMLDTEEVIQEDDGEVHL